MSSESLAKMPFSQVSHFLEVLGQNKVPDHLVRRFRLDSGFAQKISKIILAEHLENPGEKFTIEFDASQTRMQLAKALREIRAFMTLRDDIFRNIEPKNSGQEHLFKVSPPEIVEVFLVVLHKEMGEKETLATIDDMGLESVSVEEALTFAKQRTGALSQDYTIVVPSAKYSDPEDNDKVSFLDLGVTMSGRWQVGLFGFGFSTTCRFLVKRKKPQPKTED